MGCLVALLEERNSDQTANMDVRVAQHKQRRRSRPYRPATSVKAIDPNHQNDNTSVKDSPCPGFIESTCLFESVAKNEKNKILSFKSKHNGKFRHFDSIKKILMDINVKVFRILFSYNFRSPCRLTVYCQEILLT